MPSSDTQFKKGNPGGPGRPKGGRTLAIETLDRVISKNIKIFEKKLQDAFIKDPLKFWKEFGYPLVPRNIELSGMDGEPIKHKHEFDITGKELEDIVKKG